MQSKITDNDDEKTKIKAIDKYFKKMEEILVKDQKNEKRIVAIGECSLESDTNFIKTEVFKRHFDLAEKYKLPLYMSGRNAGK